MASLIVAMSVFAGPVFINEIHYDNSGADTNEGIEVAGPSGTDLTGWSLALYNGTASRLSVYETVGLSGIIPQEDSGIGAVFFAIVGVQNGAPDGLALVDPSGSLVEFFSYEGTFTAASGPASGIASIDIGVQEGTTTPIGHSLQLSGVGSDSSDFQWEAPEASTYGAANVNQTFTGEASDLPPTVSSVDPENGRVGVPPGADILVTFSEVVDLSGQWFSIEGSLSGPISAIIVAAIDSPNITLKTATDFQEGESVTIMIFASLVSDIDESPDNMTENFEWSFTVFDSSQFQIDPVPSGYYTATEGKSGTELASALHDIIDGHTVIPLSQADEAFQVLDLDLFDQGKVVPVFSGTSEPFNGFPSIWNREHLWPKSRGIDESGADTSDLFNLRPSLASINSSRGNLIFDNSDTGDAEYLPPGSFGPAPEVSRDSDSWEPPDRVKGEIARAMFYMSVRYDGSDEATLDLKLNNDPQFGGQSLIPEMGILDTLLAWNREHPVTDTERFRNQTIFKDFQGNRNPFVDFPEYADLIYNTEPSDVFGGEPIEGFPGWKASTWYLNYNADAWPWVFHDEHGWQFVSDSSTESVIFMWDSGLANWLFLNQSTYRWLYLFSDTPGWIWTFDDNVSALRFFQRGDDGSLFSVPPGL